MENLLNKKPLKAGKYLTEIPTNARIAKKYTGIGGSTAEITAKRNSVILMPSLPAVISKGSEKSSLYNVDDIHSVYGGKNDIDDIIAYINSEVEFKKIVMTMSRKSINVLIELTKIFPELFNYNLLFDEIDSVPEDATWRSDLALCYDLISIWKFGIKTNIEEAKKKKLWLNQVGSISVISATGMNNLHLPSIKNLQLYEVETQADRLNFPVTIIETESDVEGTAAKYIAKSDSEKTFIFYNNVEGSLRLINHLEENNSKIYCGDSSKHKAGIFSSDNINNFGKYNFSTKAYFRAVDFNASGEVFIISDTDSLHAQLTIEDIIQCAGRLRQNIIKITIIMNTKTNTHKLKDVSTETLLEMFKDYANQELGAIKTLDLLGELTEKKINDCEAVRRNINGEFVINYGWIENKVKTIKQDNLLHSDTKLMSEALNNYGFKSTVVKEDSTVEKLKRVEKTDWNVRLEKMCKLFEKEGQEEYNFMIRSLDNDNTLIWKGLKHLGVEVTMNTTSKSELVALVEEKETEKCKSSIGIALSKRFSKGGELESKKAKVILQELYDTFGFKSTAKATSFNLYFNESKTFDKKVNGAVVKFTKFSLPKYSVSVQ
jgi:hypothetical protein